MKKFAIGCLVVFLLVFVVGGFFAYQFVIKPSMGVMQDVQQLAELDELNDSITNKAAFSIPNNNELTETQVEDYVGTLRFIREDLRDEYEALKTSFTSLDNISGNIFGNIRNITGMSQDLIGVVKEAKLSEIKAINEINYSHEEYTWVRERVLEAAGLGAYSFGVDQLTQLSEQSGSQTLQTLEEDLQSNVDNANIPQKNIDLVQPYVEELSAILNFINLDFENLNLENLDLENLNLENLDLNNLNLENLNLEGLNLENLDLGNIDLNNIDLENLDLGNINLGDLDLENLDLGNLDLGNLDLNNLNLENLDLENLNLESLDFLNQPDQSQPNQNQPNQ